MKLSTKLARRRLMIEILNWELARCRRYDRVMSALLVGLDLPLDSGQVVTPRRINQIGNLLRDSIRESDMVGDYDRLELLGILPETPRSSALVAAERVRSAVEKRMLSLPADNGRPPVTVSIGVVGYPEDGDTVALVLAAAEGALAEARALGGNQVQLAHGLSREPTGQANFSPR